MVVARTARMITVVARFGTTELITRLSHAFSIALSKAMDVHAEGGDRRAVTEVLTTAEEIIRAIEVLRDIHGPDANVIVDGVPIVDSMWASLEATTICVAVAPLH